MSLRAPSLTRREILTALATSAVGALASTRLGATAAETSRRAEPFIATRPEVTTAIELAIPARPDGAPGASELFAELRGQSLRDIEARLVQEIASGNLPSFLRRLHPVSFSREASPGAEASTIWVMGDYLAVGSDDDYARIPFTAPAAQEIAEVFGAVLPTPELVDAIHASAEKLPGEGLNVTIASSWMDDLREHERRIAQTMRQRGVDPHALLAGHKKDVVVSGALTDNPGRVAIYGFHRDGVPIQPLSTVHVVTYTDYSHGIRLLADVLFHGGEKLSLSAVMRDPRRSVLVSRQPVAWPAYPDHWDEALLAAQRSLL